MERIDLNLASSTRLTSAITYLKGQRWHRPASLGCSVAFIASCAWLLGETVWLIPEQEHSIPAWTAAHVTVSSKPSNLDITDLKKADLFGHYTAQPVKEPSRSVAVDAPKTRLNLLLVGVVSSSNSHSSLAVISHQGSQDTYGIDETIDGTSVKLKAVLPDRVIINNGGRDETVMLNGLDYTKPTINKTSNTLTQSTQATQQQLRAIRNEIQKSPSAILKYVHMSQLKQGPVIMGYRLKPGANKALFESVGLQAGDVATKINGIDLTAQDALTKVMSALSNTKEINLTVERDNQVRTIEFAL
ncbi:type II secretion system protein GspC [Vibrio palustris]|uniref:type II secretion system protein GspC n=1 Tax=Vibrio palustris TaxID=1918946 RepID=UPI0009861F92|nr:type II secretion system protein GspC [Vibrio palustris]